MVSSLTLRCSGFVAVHCYYSNKKVGIPYNADEARHVDFPKFGERGAPMVVDIGGDRQGVSELLQAIYAKPSYLVLCLRYMKNAIGVVFSSS